mmetsp:Transcript_30244/g.46249  ORF Transcript_30244/g.46249 Transcript_30244/m.46249 type:complete len:122 (-) Transcript_30244:1004-1369(-)
MKPYHLQDHYTSLLNSYLNHSTKRNIDRITSRQDDCPLRFIKDKNPLVLSCKFLSQIVSFWNKPQNQIMLSKGKVYDKEGKEYTSSRIKFLETKVYKTYKQFEFMDPDFSGGDLSRVSREE